MPGKLVAILMTSRPMTITAEHISMRAKESTACLASLGPVSLGLESIIGSGFDNGTAIDGGAMRRRPDCDLLCPQSLERATDWSRRAGARVRSRSIVIVGAGRARTMRVAHTPGTRRLRPARRAFMMAEQSESAAPAWSGVLQTG